MRLATEVDHIDLEADLLRRVPTLQDVPPFLRAGATAAARCWASTNASAYFDADDYKAAASCTCQFRVRVAFFAPRGIVRGPSRLCAGGCGFPNRSWARLWWHQGRAVTCATRAGHWRRPQCAMHRRQGHPCSCEQHGRSERPVLRPGGRPWRQTLATARSSGSAREASTPVVAQAVRWSPSAPKRPWQPQRHGASGSGSRKLRRRRSTWNCALGLTTPSRVGATVKARAEWGPARESNSARDAGRTSARCVPHARSSQVRAAWRCQPRTWSPG